MKVAVAVFGNRISPRFDFAPEFLALEIENGETVMEMLIQASDWLAFERIPRLATLGIDTLICGAIDRFSIAQAASEGIRLECWVSGETSEVVNAFIEGELDSVRWKCPGRRGGRFSRGKGFRGKHSKGPGRKRMRGRRELKGRQSYSRFENLPPAGPAQQGKS